MSLIQEYKDAIAKDRGVKLVTAEDDLKLYYSIGTMALLQKKALCQTYEMVQLGGGSNLSFAWHDMLANAFDPLLQDCKGC